MAGFEIIIREKTCQRVQILREESMGVPSFTNIVFSFVGTIYMFYLSTSRQCVLLALVAHSIEMSLIDGTFIAWRYKGTRRFEAHVKCCVDDPTHLGDDLALSLFNVVTFYHTIDPTSLGNDMVDLFYTFDENICSI
ncbi:hypothetical protein HAX54_016201 [Datura stramonium]|uniref:Uncharacterized protein n=1 Tax=Datura stramonium TaxID=4076 RepID=A0ABS8Y5F2_DATST|nr:hypothetical protein [Datura stramonium]